MLHCELSAYIQSQLELCSPIFEELQEYRFKKHRIYSANVIRYVLLLIYTLLQSYKMLLEDCKRFIFPSFNFQGFRDIIDVQSGEISWKIFHDVFEKDETLDANLKKKPQK